MFVSERYVPEELLFLRAYDVRNKLHYNERKNMEFLEQGYRGECVYDEKFDEAGHKGVFIFRDIYLKIGQSVTQFDALIIDDNQVTINEIKNYSGKYYVRNGNWYVNNGRIGDHPFAQLKRAEGKIVKLGRDAGYSLNVHGKVIFSNDTFKMESDAEGMWDKVILRNDMTAYFDEFYERRCEGIAEDIVRLIQQYVVSNPYFRMDGDFRRIKKGLYCGNCKLFGLICHRYH